jgi:hypothetical protein
MLRSFSVSRLRVSVCFKGDIELPPFKGGILRGALDITFRRLVCPDQDIDCQSCTIYEKCPYGLIFWPTPPPEAERLRANRDVPRPFVLKPPLEGKTRYLKGEEMTFGLALVGEAQRYVKYFLTSLKRLSEEGLGKKRTPFEIKAIEAQGLGPQRKPLWDGHAPMKTSNLIRLTWDKCIEASRRLNPSRIRIRFLTPTLLRAGGQVVREPEFHHLVKRLRDRVNALAVFFCGDELRVDHREFGLKAEAVRRLDSRLWWVDRHRYSQRRHHAYKLEGFVGEATFEGPLEEYLPLLVLGQLVHVGRACVFGQGWYEVVS